MPGPTRGRKDPSLLQPDGEQGPAIELSPEELEDHTHEPENGQAEDAQPTLVFDGELLTSSVTLAVLLPGDSKESYFGAKFTARVQPGESADELMGRTITVVNEELFSKIAYTINEADEFMARLAAAQTAQQ